MRLSCHAVKHFVTVLVFLCGTLVAGEPLLPSSPTTSIVAPLAVRHGQVRQRSVLLRNTTIALGGTVRDYGYYYATVQLGTPARTFSVIVDTGSTMMYVPCKGCNNNCGQHEDDPFDPSASSTGRFLGCNDAKCQCGSPSCTCDYGKDQCTYARHYAEQSSSRGSMVEDVITLGDGGASVPVVFGCEFGETGEIYWQQADGIVGLGNGDVSLVSQLANQGVIDNTFALCFSGAAKGGGSLVLGDIGFDKLNMQYTPLQTSLQHPFYYNLELQSVFIGGDLVDVPQAEYAHGYGTVLDSGTTFTYLPHAAYVAFRRIFISHAKMLNLTAVQGPDSTWDDLCYGGAPKDASVNSFFPKVVMKFAGDATLELEAMQYLFAHGRRTGAYCLGMFDNGVGTLIGAISVRNILVQYDRRNNRIGFLKTDCENIGAAPASPSPVLTVQPSQQAPDEPEPQTPTSIPMRTASPIEASVSPAQTSPEPLPPLFSSPAESPVILPTPNATVSSVATVYVSASVSPLPSGVMSESVAAAPQSRTKPAGSSSMGVSSTIAITAMVVVAGFAIVAAAVFVVQRLRRRYAGSQSAQYATLGDDDNTPRPAYGDVEKGASLLQPQYSTFDRTVSEPSSVELSVSRLSDSSK